MSIETYIRTDGEAVGNLSTQLRHQIQIAGVHLQRYAKAHGTESADYKKRAAALETAKNLYKGLCGDERPEFVRGGRRV